MFTKAEWLAESQRFLPVRERVTCGGCGVRIRKGDNYCSEECYMAIFRAYIKPDEGVPIMAGVSPADVPVGEDVPTEMSPLDRMSPPFVPTDVPTRKCGDCGEKEPEAKRSLCAACRKRRQRGTP